MRIACLPIAARSIGLPALLAFLCTGPLPASVAGDELPKLPAGEVRLASGRAVDYTIHCDRNALRDSIRLGDGLIALTASGTLLRFELPAVRWIGERIGVEEVTCLGRGEGEIVLAGLSDGRVCRVDPVTLGLTDVTRLPAPPQWIGWAQAVEKRAAGLVVVTRPTRSVDRGGRRWDLPYSVVNDLATGKTVAFDEVWDVFRLDRSGRLWLGADNGEWGGRVAQIHLATGKVSEVKPPPAREPGSDASWGGVHGFIELRDGAIWAYGGTSHLGDSDGYITRVDRVEPRPLFALEPPEEPGKEPDRGRPTRPITQVIEEDGGLVVFAYSDVFRVDKALTSWNRVTTLEIRYRWGRPDAVGAYPSVRAVHPPRRAGEPYILATVADGYLLLEGTKAAPHGLPGQLGATNVRRVATTSEGTLLFDENEALPIWRLGPKGWETVTLAPPFEPDPASAEREENDKTWFQTRVLVGPGGVIFMVCGSNASDGTRTTARRVDGTTVRIGRETSSLDPSSSFITADGTLWNTSYRNLQRFEQGQWEMMARLSRKVQPSHLDALNANGPPWLLLDRTYRTLWRLEHGAEGADPRLTAVEIREDEKALRVWDAIPWSDGALLLATDAGLRTYAPGTRKLSQVDLAGPDQPATVLTRDGRGRLWLGGRNGLWLVEPGEQAAEGFDRVPGVGRQEVSALAPDPEHADGVIVALGSGAVTFVRARPVP